MVKTSRANLQPKATKSSSTSDEARQQHRREDGVSTQEQEGVAGVSNSSVIS